MHGWVCKWVGAWVCVQVGACAWVCVCRWGRVHGCVCRWGRVHGCVQVDGSAGGCVQVGACGSHWLNRSRSCFSVTLGPMFPTHTDLSAGVLPGPMPAEVGGAGGWGGFLRGRSKEARAQEADLTQQHMLVRAGQTQHPVSDQHVTE